MIMMTQWGAKFSKCFKMFQNVSKCFKMFQNVSKCFNMFQHVSKCFKMFQHVSKCFKMFQNVSKCFKTFQNVSKCDCSGAADASRVGPEAGVRGRGEPGLVFKPHAAAALPGRFQQQLPGRGCTILGHRRQGPANATGNEHIHTEAGT
jgi:hypothetical protein